MEYYVGIWAVVARYVVFFLALMAVKMAWANDLVDGQPWLKSAPGLEG